MMKMREGAGPETHLTISALRAVSLILVAAGLRDILSRFRDML